MSNLDPVAGFKLSDVDDAGDPKYYGYLSAQGDYYILEENTAAKTYRYFYGTGDYATDWAGRAALTYGLFSAVWPS